MKVKPLQKVKNYRFVVSLTIINTQSFALGLAVSGGGNAHISSANSLGHVIRCVFSGSALVPDTSTYQCLTANSEETISEINYCNAEGGKAVILEILD